MGWVVPLIAILSLVVGIALWWGRLDSGAQMAKTNAENLNRLTIVVTDLQAQVAAGKANASRRDAQISSLEARAEALQNGFLAAIRDTSKDNQAAIEKLATELSKNTTAVAVLTDRLDRLDTASSR